MDTNADSLKVTSFQWLFAIALGGLFAAWRWWDLLNGGGLIGGDTFTYFLPQKTVLAEAYANGVVPLWHPLTGLGYPLLAESQAGVFYPPNQILYRLLSVDSAYNWSTVGHYCLAFAFAWRFLRSQRIGNSAAWFGAAVYVYGWFPARISHEWSIVGGMWFPLTLWITDTLLERPSRPGFAVLSICLATHMLAGHFTLAFVNQLALVTYAVLHWVFAKAPASISASTLALPLCAIFAAILLAAVQLVPSYELKLASQRQGETGQFDPAFGHMPPVYATQLFASWWYWHTPEVLQSRAMLKTPGAVSADTNHVEAHLYWGTIPFLLVLASISGRVRKHVPQVAYRTWLVLGLLALSYATGWLMPIARHLPGFGFFNGPGRYTMITALSGGVISALVLDMLLAHWTAVSRVFAIAVVTSLTICDTEMASRYVADAIVVPDSAFDRIKDSWVRKAMVRNDSADTKRLWAPGPNVGNFFGVSCVPVYLGLGPAAYYQPAFNPVIDDTNDAVAPTDETIRDLKALAVTHILTTEEISQPHSTIELIDRYPDAFLNAVWRRGTAPCFLYAINDAGARVSCAPDALLDPPEITERTCNKVEFEVNVAEPCHVTLNELMYPGWKVTVDGRSVDRAIDAVPAFTRSVAIDSGRHTVRWEFQPTSYFIGYWVSTVAWILMILLGVSSVVRPQRSSQVLSGNSSH